MSEPVRNSQNECLICSHRLKKIPAPRLIECAEPYNRVQANVDKIQIDLTKKTDLCPFFQAKPTTITMKKS